MSEDWQNAGFGLYVHWPFCQAKCPYCDFNSHVSAKIDHKVWVRAYLSELQRNAKQTQNRVLNSIYFGGGTPSLMRPDTVNAIIDKAKSLWIFANDIEITLEANPGSVESGKFAAFRDAGVNRVSLGIQALNDADLTRLGRIHTASEALTALDIAHKNFDRVSFDLIYARQNQSLAEWKRELNQALTLSSDHLSLYQLTIEDGTAFGDRFARGKLQGLPPDDLGADMYHQTLEICARFGLDNYEVSNFAHPGSESRHNLLYWRYGDYVGIGPGAHGRLTINKTRYATESIYAPGPWLAATTTNSAQHITTALNRQDQADEFLMMGLRLSKGLDPQRYANLCGHSLDKEKITYLCNLDMLEFNNTQLRATSKGRVVLNAVIQELLAG